MRDFHHRRTEYFSAGTYKLGYLMIGRAHHYGIVVSDIDQSIDFYGGTLGLDVVARFTVGEVHARLDGIDALDGIDPAETEVEAAFLELDGFYLELNKYHYPPNRNGNDLMDNHDIGKHHISFEVGDIDALYAEHEGTLDFVSEPYHSEQVGVATVKFYDPDGNLVEFFTAEQTDESEPELEGFHHYALQVSDLERSLEFYCELLGMEEQFRFSPTGDVQPRLNDLPSERVDSEVAFVDANGSRIEIGDYTFPESENANGYLDNHDVGRGHFSIFVDDTDAVYEELNSEMEFLSTPQRVHDGPRLVKGCDPDGNVIEFLSGLQRLA